MKKKNISKMGKILLLIAVIFSYVSSPIAVLADEITVNYNVSMNIIGEDTNNDGYTDKYNLNIDGTSTEFDDNKDYKLLINDDIKKSYFMFDDNTKLALKSNEIIANGSSLKNNVQTLSFDSVSKYFNGKYHVTVEIYDVLDTTKPIHSDVYEFNYDKNLGGLTGTLNNLKGDGEVYGATTTNTYRVSTEGEYIPTYHILTGDLLPEVKYNVILNNEPAVTLTGLEIVNHKFYGTKLDLTNKLYGTYEIVDTFTIEEYKNVVQKEEVTDTVIEEVAEDKDNNTIEEANVDVDNSNTEISKDESTNKITYTYKNTIIYGENNDELFNNKYLDKNVKFEDGYLFADAKNYNDSKEVITIGDLKLGLADSGIELILKDKDGNTLELTDSDEIKNGYILELTKGATARYEVVVFGDNNLDNTFDKKDLESLMKDYLDGKKVNSMDLISPAFEVVPSEDVKPIEEEEFGTITFDDVMYINELLKENSNITDERLNNENLGIILGDIPKVLYEGDTFTVKVLVDSSNAEDYIDGIEGSILTNNNLKLDNVTFNSAMTSSYNNNGKFVLAGNKLSNKDIIMELTFTCLNVGEGSFEINTRGAKYLNIEKKFTNKTGTINIVSKLSSNNNLNSIKSSVGTFDTEFNKDITTYTLTVPYDTTKVILSGELADVNSKVSGLIEYELIENSTLASIVVTAENGEEKVYTVYIVKEAKPVINKPIVVYYPSSNNNLKDLKIEGYEIDFSKDVYEYNIKIKKDIESLDIRAITENGNASVEITGNENFKAGENIVLIKVTAEDGTVKEYKLIVNKEDKTVAPSKIDEDSTNGEKIVIIVLIVLVVLGLLYLIFKKDDEEEIEIVKEEKPNKAKDNKSECKDVKATTSSKTKASSGSKNKTNSNSKTSNTKKKK